MADFRFFINRQGPRGPQGLQGEKGDPGNTFTVSEGVNTPTEYTLIFDGGDGNQFETDNLRNPIVDRGGTYVRYDRDNVTQYIGEPDMAVIDETPGIVNLAGKDTVTPNASDAVAYELLEKTVDELNTALENLDGRLDDTEGDLTQAQSDIVGLDNRVTTNEGNITSLQSGKADKSTTYTKTEVNNALAGKANTVHTHTVSQITDAGALASQNTVDYQTQVTNKPIIPTVGNGTITLTQGGVTKGTFTTNQSGNSTIDLDAGGGSTLTAGNAINISSDVISVKYDGTTIGLNASGQLQSLVEEPDMTQYYTKSQVDDLIPDVSGFASSIDVGTMFTGATETKEDNVKLDVANSYQNITGGTQFEDNKYYLNWDSNVNTGFYAVPKTANETIPIMNVCIYKTTSIEDPNTKQTTTTTVPFLYVSDWLNSTGNRSVTAYTQDTYSFGTDTIQSYPVGMIDEEAYQAIQDMQNAGLNLFYKDSGGKFQKVHSIEPSSVTGFYDVYLETIGYNFPMFDSTTGGFNSYTFYMGWQQTAPTVALHVRNTDNYSTSGMTYVSINITKTDLDNMLNPTTGVTPDYEWENTRFAQYTDYASTQKAGLVKVGNNLSIAADGTLSANTQAPTAGAGVSVNGTAVSVNVDNSTITINNDGQLTANIPTPATVDQTYNASSTNAQSGVAIAGAGFMNGNIVQSPLEYLPDTTGSLTYQNVNTSTMVGSGKGIYAAFTGNATASNTNIAVGTESGFERLKTYEGDKADLISNSSLTWFETELTNGINFACKKVIQSNSTFSYVLGHYENSKFIPDAIFGNPYNFPAVYFYIVSSDTYYYPASGTGYGSSDTYSYYLSGLTLTAAINGSNSNKGTYTVTQADADILNAVTHIRVYVNEVSTSTLTLSDIKVVNPTLATPVTDGNNAERQAILENGTNIFDAHPESLSLKYDGTTLGINASNELYAISSAPSNMVTTDTAQTISGEKKFTSYYTYMGNSLAGIGAINGNNGVLKLGLTDVSTSSNYHSVLFKNSNGHLVLDLGLQSGTKFYVNRNGSTYYTTTVNNFLLEKDMLDGTTIQYNDTSGKVEVIGGGGGGADLKQYSSEFTIEGSLVNTNGVLSSFSDLNYAKIPSKYFAVGNSIRVKFNFVTKSTARQYVLAGEGFLNIDVNTSSTTLRTWNNTTAQNDDITTLTSGQDYYLRIDLKDTGKDFYVTQDPSNWGTAVTVADTAYVTTAPPDEVITIGLNTVKTNSYWNSTIDSNYIEIYDSDGVLIYKIDDNDQIATKQRLGLIKPDGLTVTVNEQGMLSANISSGIGTSLSSEGNLNLIISDCDYNISSELNSMATTNTFNDGILELSHAGEWTSGNMLKNPYNGILIDEKCLTNVQDFEIVIKYKGDCGIILNSTPATLNWMESTIAIPNLCAFGNVWWNNQLGDKNPRAFCYNIDGGNSFTPDYSINLLGITDKYKYWKLKREGSTLTYGYSSDGITYTTLYTSSSFSNTNSITGPISIGTSFVNDTPSGGMLRFGYSLDLKESYIKCDGKLTWGLYGTNGIAKATDTTYGLVTKNHPMPGDIFETVIVGASGAEYTASDTGWFILGFTASANNQYLEVTKPLDNGYGTSLNITVFRSQVYGSTTNYIGTSIPVKKGDKITVNYNTGGTNNIIFVPAAS